MAVSNKGDILVILTCLTHAFLAHHQEHLRYLATLYYSQTYAIECFEWKSSFLLSNNVYSNSVSHPIHMALSPFGNKCIQISKGENLCASPQGLFEGDKRTYWSTFHWRLAWLEARCFRFGSLGHSNFIPNPTRTRVCSSLSGFFCGLWLPWKNVLVWNTWEGSRQPVGRGELVSTNPSFCRHQHLEDYLHNLNRESKEKKKERTPLHCKYGHLK